MISSRLFQLIQNTCTPSYCQHLQRFTQEYMQVAFHGLVVSISADLRERTGPGVNRDRWRWVDCCVCEVIVCLSVHAESE